VGSNINKVTVPVNAMLFRSEGSRLAVVGPDNKVELRAISIGKDYGTTLEVLAGVSIQDRIVINPPDSLDDGQRVTLAPPSQGQGQDQSAAPPPAVPQSTTQEEDLPQQQRRSQGQQTKSNKVKGSGQ